MHLEALSRSDLDVAQRRPLLDTLEVGATAHPDDAHRRRVTLDQRVHRLRGGVGDEIDVVRPDPFGEFRDGLHHTSRDPTVGRVRRRHHHGGDDRSTREFDGDSFRERSTDIDPDADSGHVGAVTPRAAVATRWRSASHGLRTNMCSAPNTYTVARSSWATSDGTVGHTPVASARKIGRRGRPFADR